MLSQIFFSMKLVCGDLDTFDRKVTVPYTVKTKVCYPYFFGMVFLLTLCIPFFGMLCILPVCNPHPKRYEMHTLNIFQNKRNTFKY